MTKALQSSGPLYRRFSDLFSKGFRIDWVTALYISITHLLVLVATPFAYYFAPSGFWQVMLGWTLLHALFACISVTSYTHRLISHGAARRIRWPVHLLFGFIGHGLAVQGTVRTWASMHILHHAVDRSGKHHLDPYSATWFPDTWRNFLWSHVLTFFFHHPQSDEYDRIFDKQSDGVLLVQEKTHVPLMVVLNYVLPFALGFWLTGGVVGGLCLMVASMGGFILAQHNTWTVNSVTHMFGFKKGLTSSAKNNYVWIGPLGEGNHHADHHDYCRDYRNGFGIKGWVLDPTRYVILGLRALGWVRGLRRASKLQEVNIITRRRLRDARAFAARPGWHKTQAWKDCEEKLEELKVEWLEATQRWETFKAKKLRLKAMSLPRLELKQKLAELKSELNTAKQAMREAKAEFFAGLNDMQQVALAAA